MRGTKAKRLRREAAKLPQKPKQLNPPELIEIEGKMQFVPRRTRRKMIRMFLADYRKGRL